MQVAIIDELVHLENVSNVRFENIRFEGSNKNAFFLKNVKQVQVIGCDFKFNVQGWRLLYGKDAGSRSSPKTISPFTITRFVGSNQFSNGDFYSNAGGLYAFSAAGNITTGWSGEGLDGGSLKVSFNNISSATSKGTVIIGIGSIKANHSYVLKMSVRGANNSKQMELYLRKSLAPYNDISLRKLINTPISRKEISLLFVPVETQSNASIGMDIPEQNTPVYDAG